MRTQPKILFYLSIFLVLTVISFPVQIMILYGHSPAEVAAIFSKISSLNWVVMGFASMTAFLIFRASPKIKIMVPVLLVLVGINNGFVSSVADDYSPWVAYGATLLFFMVHLGLLHPDIQMILDHPDRRWWRTALRKRLELMTTVCPFNQDVILRKKTFDISENGAFIPSGNSESFSQMKTDDQMTLCLNLGALSQLRCQAKVIRVVPAKGQYPAGLGLKFTGLGFQERRRLRKYIRRQEPAFI